MQSTHVGQDSSLRDVDVREELVELFVVAGSGVDGGSEEGGEKGGETRRDGDESSRAGEGETMKKGAGVSSPFPHERRRTRKPEKKRGKPDSPDSQLDVTRDDALLLVVAVVYNREQELASALSTAPRRERLAPTHRAALPANSRISATRYSITAAR